MNHFVHSASRSCLTIEDIYICKGQPKLRDDGCEIAIISKDNSSNCPSRLLTMPSNIIEQFLKKKVPTEAVKVPYSYMTGNKAQLVTEPTVISLAER